PIRATDALPDTLALTLVSLVTGGLALVLLPRVSSATRLERARAQMLAAIYEIRLYLASPAAIARAFGRFLRWSGVYLLLTMPLALSMAPLAVPWYLDLEARYGLSPLPVGAPVLGQVWVANGVEARALEVAARGPIRVSPLLVIEEEGRIYFNLTLD